MVIEVGEDFKKEFNRELENCTTQVNCKSEEHYGNANAHFRWSELVGPRVSMGLQLSASGLGIS